MKTVAKLIIVVRVWGLVDICEVINTISTSKIAYNMQCWYVLSLNIL